MSIEDNLRRKGWRRIVSQSQADQLLRRELKHHAKEQQRTGGLALWDFRDLLAIKPGNWYKFLRFSNGRKSGHCSIVLWRPPQQQTADTHSKGNDDE